MKAAFRIDTVDGRLKLGVRREPYWRKIVKDRHVGLRKINATNSTWIARYRGDDGKRAFRALGDVTKEFGFDQAVAAAQAWFRERDRGIKATAETVAEVAALYVEDRRRQKADAVANEIDRRFQRTIYGREKASRAKAVEPNALGSIRLAKLRQKDIETWRDELVADTLADGKLAKKGLSRASANRTLTALKAALNYAVRHRYVGADAALEWKAVQPFKGASRRRDLYLDVGQRRALIGACEGALKDLVMAAALTGARAGELTSARRSQFDARTESITLSGKTGQRTVPLAPAAVALFAKLAKSKLPNAYLLTRDDGKPWGHSDWDEHVRAAAVAADLPKGVCLYALRHAWITQAITDGMSVLEVGRLVGTSIAMIDRNYGHLAQGSARERLAKLALV